MTKEAQEMWKLINSFAPWLAALGTITTAITALYLARADRRVRLQVSAGHRIMIAPGARGPYPEYLYITVINAGLREAEVTDIGWKVGVFQKKYAVQVVETTPNLLPARLKYGEKVQFYIPLDDDWINQFVKDMVGPWPRVQVYFVKIRAFSSLATFESRIEKNLRKKLVEAKAGKEATR